MTVLDRLYLFNLQVGSARVTPALLQKVLWCFDWNNTVSNLECPSQKKVIVLA